MSILSRSAWGAAAPRASSSDPRLVVPHSQVTVIVLHHGASSTGSGPDDVPRVLRGYQATHFHRGYRDIAYHWAIDAWGRIWALRPSNERGAHSYPNTGAWGIVYVGDGRYGFTDAAHQALRWLIGHLDELRGRELPIRAHSQRQATACPGDLIRAVIPGLRGGGPVVRPGSQVSLEQALQLAGWLARPYDSREYWADLQQHGIWRGLYPANMHDGIPGPLSFAAERALWEQVFNAPEPEPEPDPEPTPVPEPEPEPDPEPTPVPEPEPEPEPTPAPRRFPLLELVVGAVAVIVTGVLLAFGVEL